MCEPSMEMLSAGERPAIQQGCRQWRAASFTISVSSKTAREEHATLHATEGMNWSCLVLSRHGVDAWVLRARNLYIPAISHGRDRVRLRLDDCGTLPKTQRQRTAGTRRGEALSTTLHTGTASAGALWQAGCKQENASVESLVVLVAVH